MASLADALGAARAASLDESLDMGIRAPMDAAEVYPAHQARLDAAEALEDNMRDIYRKIRRAARAWEYTLDLEMLNECVPAVVDRLLALGYHVHYYKTAVPTCCWKDGTCEGENGCYATVSPKKA